MGKTFKTGDSITLYFGDTMRELLSKSLRKRNIYFVDCKIIAIEGGNLTVFSQMKNAKDNPPYKVMGICVGKNDKHILPEGVLEELRDFDKDQLAEFASDRGYDVKEFKAALKPYRKGGKKD